MKGTLFLLGGLLVILAIWAWITIMVWRAVRP
jgi:hypothetical protein